MKKLISILLLSILFVSCESSEKRYWRIATDNYFYYGERGEIHLDSKCKYIGKFYRPILKSDCHNSSYNMIFCPKCCKIEDIEKFKSQIK